MQSRIFHFCWLCLWLGSGSLGAAPASDTDICIYGGTSAGISAAVQAVRMGKSAVIVSPDKHLGGLSSGGLGWTDSGDKAVIGGISREFYQRVRKVYEREDAWPWQKPPSPADRKSSKSNSDADAQWIFEPQVAEQVFEDFIREYHIPVHRDEWLDRANGVKNLGARISAITTLSGKTYRAKMFIDATYEGDLMAAAGVDYQVGREGTNVYGEEWNGIQTGVLHHRHHFGVLSQPISPYVIPGDAHSGVLPRVSADPPEEKGQGDKKIQAYCFRLCLTDNPDNLVPLPKPDGYDPAQYELMIRIYKAGWKETFSKFDRIPNRKTDVNNHGPMSSDDIGFNYDYPEASYERRREIVREHENYQKGWLYFIANDPRVPGDVQEKMRKWGLAKDEFRDNGNWPYQIYIREARRMVGAYVMTENDLLKKRLTPDSVGMGSYGIDSHNIQRYITPEGYVQNEGDIGVSTRGPYQIAYGALVPKRGQAENLLVPVCASASHIAFGSIRMEPVFMILGQSAATAAAMAIDSGTAVQDVPYRNLRERLIKDHQVLEYAKSSTKTARTEAGPDASFDRWLKPQNWQRDSDTPALSLGEKGAFDDQHIFAPHVIYEKGEYWMYYSGSQRCVDAGTYKGRAQDPAHPEKSDQRLFKLGLARSKDGIHFTRVASDPIFSFGDDIHSVVTAAILKNPDGSVHREKGKLRMYFAAVDFPGGTYKHDLYETTSADGIHWEKPTFVMENAYAPCVIKEGARYRLWHTWILKHPWHTSYAESRDGTHWKESDQPAIVMDQAWEVKDQVYPMVIKAGGVYLMMYGCYWNDDKHTALGFAASKDGINWTKHPNNPVFRPEPAHDWESHFTTSQTMMRLPDGNFRIWYAGRKQPPWSNLYFAIGTAHWAGPGRP